MEQQNLNHCFSLAMEFGIVVFNGLDNAGAEPLTILLGIKKEGAVNKV